MNWFVLWNVICVSIIMTIIWQLLFTVYPSWRRLKIAQSLSALAQSLNLLNQDALVTAKIRHNQYLHDRHYRFLYNALTHKVDLRFRMLKVINHDAEAERECRKFHEEIENLDAETKEILRSASYAVGKILLFRSPIIFLLICLKIKRKRNSFLSSDTRRKKVTDTAEYITISARDDDYQLIPVPAAS